MRTIYAYGDSFIADRQDNKPGWAIMLSKKINAQLINRGVSGGSTENAMLKFTFDIDKIQPDDIVLFQLSTPGRLNFKFQIERPETASVYWHDVDPNDSRHVWYHENKQHIQWYIKNYNHNISVMNHNSYIHTVRNFAENNPNVTVVLMQNTTLPMNIPLPTSKENFIVIPTDLDIISKNEYVRSFEYSEWNQYTKYDVRINHMSNKNLDVLSNLIKDALITRRADNFRYDQFHQKIFDIILSKQDHDAYFQQGLLYDMSYMFADKK